MFLHNTLIVTENHLWIILPLQRFSGVPGRFDYPFRLQVKGVHGHCFQERHLCSV
jgi:hypothetical protein